MNRKSKIAGTALAAVCTVAARGAAIGAQNGKVMKRTVEDGLKALRQQYEVVEVPAEPYKTITLYGLMKFEVEHYKVIGLGNLCIMTMNAGIMQMSTFVLTPYEKNMPMLSMDFIYIWGKRKGLVEYYDLVADPMDAEYREVLTDMKNTLASYSDLKNYTPEKSWQDALLQVAAFKSGTSAQDDRFAKMLTDSVTAYAANAGKLPVLPEEKKEEKRKITQQYCEDLVSRGGISTDQFKKVLGEETTLDFFGKVFFGTQP